MLRRGDVVQLGANHDLYGGLMFVIDRVTGEEMSGTIPGISSGAIKLPTSLACRKIGRVPVEETTFYGLPGTPSQVSYRCEV